jgi:hypothetical protein
VCEEGVVRPAYHQALVASGAEQALTLLDKVGRTLRGRALPVVQGRNHSLTSEMELVRRNLGLCPQHDILVDTLSPTQNIELFCAFKRLSRSCADRHREPARDLERDRRAARRPLHSALHAQHGGGGGRDARRPHRDHEGGRDRHARFDAAR